MQVIDPFVTIEVFGIPADISQERTRTVPHNGRYFLDVIFVCLAHSTVIFQPLSRFVFFSPGYNPVFDETFEFHINLPDLALVRFVVQDDDFIGDGFIGQYTIPLNCIQPGNGQMRGCGGYHSSEKKNILVSLVARLLPSPRL